MHRRSDHATEPDGQCWPLRRKDRPLCTGMAQRHPLQPPQSEQSGRLEAGVRRSPLYDCWTPG
ncbi:hypothetical protein, partial [Bellilinea sp.]